MLRVELFESVLVRREFLLFSAAGLNVGSAASLSIGVGGQPGVSSALESPTCISFLIFSTLDSLRDGRGSSFFIVTGLIGDPAGRFGRGIPH